MKFMMQFVNLRLGLAESLPAGGRDLVDPALAPSNILENGLQQPSTLQSMKQRVESSWSNTIPVVHQLLHHGQSEDWLMRSVHQHVNPYKTEKEFPLLFQHKINILR